MPIKPENRGRYPADWKKISREVKEAQKWRCAFCKVKHGERIARGAGNDSDTYQTSDAEVFCANTGRVLGVRRMGDYEVKNMVTIVLTTAHLDHQPENCARANLAALCQRCHLAYDALHHKATAQATRRQRSGTAALFPEIEA